LFELFWGLAKTASESEWRRPDPQGAAQKIKLIEIENKYVLTLFLPLF
jgi:hypothetical protein